MITLDELKAKMQELEQRVAELERSKITDAVATKRMSSTNTDEQPYWPRPFTKRIIP